MFPRQQGARASWHRHAALCARSRQLCSSAAVSAAAVGPVCAGTHVRVHQLPAPEL